jgi:hypothetical protein
MVLMCAISRGTGGSSGTFNNPNRGINAFGRLGLDSPIQIKAGGTYELPYQIQASAIYTHFSGFPYTRQLRTTTDINGVRLNVGTITILAEPRGSKRLPALDQVNLNLAKTVRLNKTQTLKLMLDVFNVSNVNKALALSTLSGSSFGSFTSVAPPRYARLGVRYQF